MEDTPATIRPSATCAFATTGASALANSFERQSPSIGAFSAWVRGGTSFLLLTVECTGYFGLAARIVNHRFAYAAGNTRRDIALLRTPLNSVVTSTSTAAMVRSPTCTGMSLWAS